MTGSGSRNSFYPTRSTRVLAGFCVFWVLAATVYATTSVYDGDTEGSRLYQFHNTVTGEDAGTGFEADIQFSKDSEVFAGTMPSGVTISIEVDESFRRKYVLKRVEVLEVVDGMLEPFTSFGVSPEEDLKHEFSPGGLDPQATYFARLRFLGNGLPATIEKERRETLNAGFSSDSRRGIKFSVRRWGD